MKYPSFFPYPISWIRATVQIIAIGVSILLIWGELNPEWLTPDALLQPFGLVSFLLIPVVISIVLHLITQQLFYVAKGVGKPYPLNSLWEGIYGWMVTIFAFTLTLLFFIVPLVLTVDLSEIDSNKIPYSVGYVGIYFVITVYLYQLEYLIRYPQSLETPVAPTTKKTVAKTTILSSPPSTSVPQAPPVKTPENEIEAELNYLKNQRNNGNQSGK